MVQKVVWTHKAILTFDAIIEYLLLKFGNKEAERFAELVQNKLALIRSRPTMFRRSTKYANTYRTVIHKRVILVYSFKPRKKEVYLLHFWSTRMSPEKFRY